MTESATNPPAAAPALDESANDPLAHLHRMSRTAGMGSGDYVAINALAVTSIIFGLASALVVVDPLFLVLPLVGLILSIVALRQIKNSNGTQTGTLMAILALLLSIGFITFKVGGQVYQGIGTRADRRVIEGLVNAFGQDLNRGDAAAMGNAYGKFNSAFAMRVSREHFELIFNSARSSPFFGPIAGMESNGQLKFDVDQRTNEQIAAGIAIVHLQKPEGRDEPRWMLTFRKAGGRWQLEDMPELFPAQQPAAPPAQSAPR